MITSISEAQAKLEDEKLQYSAYREYFDISIMPTAKPSLILLVFKTEYTSYEPYEVYLPISGWDFEEELSRAYDLAVWADTPVNEEVE